MRISRRGAAVCAGSAAIVHEVETQAGMLVRNVLAGGGSSLIKVATQLVMLPMMARFLGPREFGLFATALPLISFFAVVADGGLGASLAKGESTSIVWSTAFYVMLIVSVTLVAILNVCGFIMSAALHEPRLQLIMEILSISFVFIGFSVLPSARLVQANNLVAGSLLDVLSTISGAVVAIVLAHRGFGALSLAYQYVVGYGVRAVGLSTLAFQPPRLEFSLAALTRHFHTGGSLVGSRLLDLFCRCAENFLLSETFGASGLGAYTFATQISRFVCEAASNPIWSALYAQAIREPPGMLSRLLVNTMRLMMIVTFPATCLIASAAPHLLQQALGAKWLQAAPILRCLAPSYSLATTASLCSAALLATNRNRAFLATAAVFSFGRILAVMLGYWIGLLDVCVVIAIVNLAYAGLMVQTCRRLRVIDAGELLRRTAGPAAASILAGSGSLGVFALFPPSNLVTLVSLTFGSVTFLVSFCLLEGERLRVEVHSLLGLARRRKGPAGAAFVKPSDGAPSTTN